MELTDEFSEFIRDMEAMLLCQKQRMLRALAPAFASASASASLGQAPVARSNERRWAHQQLTADGREAFIALYREMESRDGVFRFFASSSAALRSWPAVVLAEQFLLSALFLWARPSSASASLLLSALACVLGVLALQLTFVASHTAAHALMLEYSEHRPGSKRMTRMGQIIPVYFFAFYHHHASRDDVCTQAIYTVACDSFMGRFFLPYRSLVSGLGTVPVLQRCLQIHASTDLGPRRDAWRHRVSLGWLLPHPVPAAARQQQQPGVGRVFGDGKDASDLRLLVILGAVKQTDYVACGCSSACTRLLWRQPATRSLSC
jgi:hypothetical protein